MTEDEVDEVIRKAKARLEVIEMAIEGLKQDVDKIQRWNPCQRDLRERDINWP